MNAYLPFDIIAFDADDTLWENEPLYNSSQARFAKLLAGYVSIERIHAQLYETEMRNLRLYGYGIKGFALSMIETAIELTDRRVSGADIQQILDLAKEQLLAPTRLLDHVADVVAELARDYRLMLLTKGDLFDQESKLARSGLGAHFTHIEVVSEKTPATYQAIFTRYAVEPARFLMVGNSLRSDILPITLLGARAVYIPFHTTWAHELVHDDHDRDGYVELGSIAELPALIGRMGAGVG